jgi:hypothetical protein
LRRKWVRKKEVGKVDVWDVVIISNLVSLHRNVSKEWRKKGNSKLCIMC